MENKVLANMNASDLRELIREELNRITIKIVDIMHNEAMNKFICKKQITKSEIIAAFDLATFNTLVNRKGLKKIRQDGKTAKIYYDTSEVLKKTLMSYY